MVTRTESKAEHHGERAIDWRPDDTARMIARLTPSGIDPREVADRLEVAGTVRAVARWE